MHNVLNQNQYYNALKGKSQDENTGTTFDGVVKAYQVANELLSPISVHP